MVENPNNEPAFPCETNGNPNGFQSGEMLWTYPGMTLRDWFAGQALAGQTANGEFACSSEEMIAQASYRLADAMLAERSK